MKKLFSNWQFVFWAAVALSIATAALLMHFFGHVISGVQMGMSDFSILVALCLVWVTLETNAILYIVLAVVRLFSLLKNRKKASI